MEAAPACTDSALSALQRLHQLAEEACVHTWMLMEACMPRTPPNSATCDPQLRIYYVSISLRWSLSAGRSGHFGVLAHVTSPAAFHCSSLPPFPWPISETPESLHQNAAQLLERLLWRSWQQHGSALTAVACSMLTGFRSIVAYNSCCSVVRQSWSLGMAFFSVVIVI